MDNAMFAALANADAQAALCQLQKEHQALREEHQQLRKRYDELARARDRSRGVTKANIELLHELKAHIYSVIRAYEDTLTTSTNHHPVGVGGPVRISVKDGRFVIALHGQTMPSWQIQEMPEVVFPAFQQLRQELEKARRGV